MPGIPGFPGSVCFLSESIHAALKTFQFAWEHSVPLCIQLFFVATPDNAAFARHPTDSHHTVLVFEILS